MTSANPPIINQDANANAKKKPITHNTTFAIQIRVNLLLKGSLVHVPRTNRNTNRHRLLLRLARHILPHRHARVDSPALLEERPDGPPRTLRRNEDNINISRRHDVRVVLVHDGEPVREVERLALGEERCDLGPCLRLRGVREEVHDDRPAVNRFLNGEERLSWDLSSTQTKSWEGQAKRYVYVSNDTAV